MRLLSGRLRALQQPCRINANLGGFRASSRYSNPGLRATTAPPASAPSFIDSRSELDSLSADPTNVRLGDASAQRQHEAVRAHHLRRMRFAGIGLVVSAAGLAITLYNLDLDDIEKAGKKNKIQLEASEESNDKFQGRNVHIIGAGDDARVVAEGKDEIELVQTGSGSVPYFPRRLYLPAPETSSDSPAAIVKLQTEDEYTLVGLGIRTVTFLGIEVSRTVMVAPSDPQSDHVVFRYMSWECTSAHKICLPSNRASSI